MWSMIHRLCRAEVAFLSALTFLLGLSLAYFTMYYVGYSLDACRDTKTYTVKENSLSWPGSKEKGGAQEDLLKDNAESAKRQDKPPPTIHEPTTKPFVASISYTPQLTKATNSNATLTNVSLPTVFAITPTYARYTQRVDLTSLCHTLMHVPELIWIVVEDANSKTELVTNLLKNCKTVYVVHMNIKLPPPPLPGGQKVSLARGVAQRNAGLSWIRKYCKTTVCRGAVYFMDDDNKYDLQLFEEIRWTKVASVFPVGFAGGLKFEGPVCENGRAKSWHVSFAPERSVPIDMAGFAVNVNELINKPNVVIGKDKNGDVIRRLEPNFIEQFTTKETAECLGGKEIMAWHVKTLTATNNEKRNPSDPSYAV